MWMCRFWISLTLALAAAADAAPLAVEWIPLGRHEAVLDAVAHAVPELERFCCYADAEALDERLEALCAAPPPFVLVFGDEMGRRVREACPQVPLLVLLARSPEMLAAMPAKAPLATIAAQPEPNDLHRLAERLTPGFRAIAVLYTEGYAPNEAFSQALEQLAQEKGFRAARTTVHIGFCRTESDFAKAVAAVEGVDWLYVPDDPNAARFGPAIYSAAARHGIFGIGAASTRGQGGVAAFEWDPTKLAQAAVQAVQALREQTGAAHTAVRIAPTVVFDAARIAAAGLEIPAETP
jgi:hypothetical protein